MHLRSAPTCLYNVIHKFIPVGLAFHLFNEFYFQTTWLIQLLPFLCRQNVKQQPQWKPPKMNWRGLLAKTKTGCECRKCFYQCVLTTGPFTGEIVQPISCQLFIHYNNVEAESQIISKLRTEQAECFFVLMCVVFIKFDKSLHLLKRKVANSCSPSPAGEAVSRDGLEWALLNSDGS